MVHRFISNLWEEKMSKTLAPLRDFIDWIKHRDDQAGSLVHLDFVI